MLKVTTVNVNGIRAAARKDMAEWLKQANPDILCLQEVRAPQGELLALAVDGPIAIMLHIILLSGHSIQRHLLGAIQQMAIL